MIPICILTIEDPDDRAFMTALYVKYEKLLYSTAVQVTGHEQDAQDVVGTVLVKIIQDKIPLLRSLPERKQLNYLITACRNTAVSCLRKRNGEWGRLFEDTIEAVPDGAPTLEELLLAQEEQQLFLQAWETLDERTQYLLNARYILDQSISEIAAELHTSQAQVRTYLSRARKKALRATQKLKDG